MEFIPFRAAIAHGVDSVMTAHLAGARARARGIPSTVSKKCSPECCADELGFKGIVVTDAMDMQGLTALYSPGEAAVRALEAGRGRPAHAADPEACIRALMAAVKSGRISRQRINSSAAKIMAAKQRVGLFRGRYTSLDQITDRLDDPSFGKLAQDVADHAVTLVRDDKHLFPIPTPADGSCLVVMSEGLFSQRGETMQRILQQRIPQLKACVVDSETPVDELTAIATGTGRCEADLRCGLRDGSGVSGQRRIGGRIEGVHECAGAWAGAGSAGLAGKPVSAARLSCGIRLCGDIQHHRYV